MQQDLFSANRRPRAHADGLVIDLFCGGGGASEGLRLALGRHPDFAVNHSAEAIAIHEANHPTTIHFRGDVWDANPSEVAHGRRVSVLHLSPTCTHFSRAKGGPLKDAKLRSLPWVAVRWIRETRPDMFTLENVCELKSWGRLLANGTVDPRYLGHTFKTWLGKIRSLGYNVDMRELRGCDFGAPTTRKRLFIVGRRDNQPIYWPEATHGPGLLPFRDAASCMDWSVPAASIFERSKPLAGPTLRRIARALHKHVLSGNPYIVPGVGAATMVQTGYGEHEKQKPRALDIRAPLGTVVAGATKHALVVATLVKNFGGNGNGGSGLSMRAPLSTITCQDHHSLVAATMIQLNGTSSAKDLRKPLGAITAGGEHFALVQAHVQAVDEACGVSPERRAQIRELLALGDGEGHADTEGVVTIGGEQHVIVDVLLRMLTPRELSNAQGFGPAYELAPVVNGKPLSKTAQIRAIGNSVCPQIVEAIIRANLAPASTKAAA